MRLPASLDQLTGLRAARWTRESTSGQYDAFGPEAQRDQQDRAIERYGLIDTGLAWTVAHSGRTVGSTQQFRDMIECRDYDVLVVGYVSRFARDLRTAVNARHDLHAAGAVILFADERLLTSDDEAWDSWAREAVEAESYSRKLARRVREGYATKRRMLGQPGGQPPLGYFRQGRVLVPDRPEVVRSLFADAAAGFTDRELARRASLSLHVVRSTLTNPIYIGQFRDGSPASVEAMIDTATWNRVQSVRAARNARGGRPSVRRTYTLPMLRCASCGRGLIGDSGRYRHLEPCPEFTTARPRQVNHNRLIRTPGHSYRKDRYESLIPSVLRQVGWQLDAAQLAEGAAEFSTMAAPIDEVGLRRVESARERALTAYRSHRDGKRLEADMTRLDAEDLRIRSVQTDMPSWSEVLAVLRDAPAMWEALSDAGRRRMAGELFESIDALGMRQLTVNFASGVQALVSVGAKGFEPSTS
jgi:DNA invertase Pin-like site-specific DNA recombinase